MYAMSKIYYNQIIKGKRKFSDTPVRYKEEVKKLLIDNEYEDLIDEET